MLRYETLEDITRHWGEPVLRFKPEGDFTETEIALTPIPDELVVVEIPHATQIMVFSKFGDKWKCNEGERFVIRHLLHITNVLSYEKSCDGCSLLGYDQ